MGKPAARVTDTTAHGGMISGPGASNVLIGKMPAATLGDMHVCPMVTGPVPHVGGPIVLGSTGVFLGKKPAARMGDMAVCVGPPSTVLMGCATVLIGEAGSGSQAASAGAAAEASLVNLADPSSIAPFPLAPPPPAPTQLHECRFKFVDSAGRVLAGTPYLATLPDNQVLEGASDSGGKAAYASLPASGQYAVVVKDIFGAAWDRSTAAIGDDIVLSARADGFSPGEEASISIFERSSSGRDRFVARLSAPIASGRIQATWKAELPPLDDADQLEKRSDRRHKRIHFGVYAAGAMAISQPLRLKSNLLVQSLDEWDKPVGNRQIKVQDANGAIHTATTDNAGEASFPDVSADGSFVFSKE